MDDKNADNDESLFPDNPLVSNPFSCDEIKLHEETDIKFESTGKALKQDSIFIYPYPIQLEIPIIEIYKYRVVYPGGTYVRISPHFHAEKLGDILEFGTVFETTRSLVLDGINYVYVSKPSGWIFESKHGVKVLELIDVVRMVYTDPYGHFYAPHRNERRTIFKAKQQSSKLLNVIRQDRRYWRVVRSKCSAVKSFDELIALGKSLDSQPPIDDNGPARISWIENAIEEHDQRIRNIICRITAITRQSVDIISLEDFESSLWLFAHLGAKASHALQIAAEAANSKFEKIQELKFRNVLLSTVLDVGARSRPLMVELARMTGIDLLPDDIRNFLQRWIIIRYVDTFGMQLASQPVRQSSGSASVSAAIPRKLTGHNVGVSHQRSINAESRITVDRTPKTSQETDLASIAACLLPGPSPQTLVSAASPSVGDHSKTRSQKSAPESESNSRQVWKKLEAELRRISDPTVQLATLI